MIGSVELDRASENPFGFPVWAEATHKEPAVQVRTAPPDRYRVRAERGGEVLTCIEAPTVKIRIEQGFSVTATAARSAKPGSIFLDGAAQGEPFLDPKREVYNLDHHEGCIRAFTLATCEQAMVLIRKGLDLRTRDWTVYANAPDLDTVLAIWVLLNHIRLNGESAETRARIMPVLRLQGVIDAHGFELQDLCALPPKLLAETRAWIQKLRERELLLMDRGGWKQENLLGHTADQLRAIDRLVYPPTYFDDLEEIEELERADITDHSIAIICRSNGGIYEVSRELQRLHGGRLGVVALQKDDSTYSLRQVDARLPANLENVYAHLNLVDPAAGGQRSPNRWGGSAEIGGSPRSTGTRATPQQIAVAFRQAFRTPTLVQRLLRVAGAMLRSVAIILPKVASLFALGMLSEHIPLPAVFGNNPATHFALLLAVLASSFFLFKGVRAPGLYGCRRPAAFDWLILLPLAVVAALAGGVWIPAVELPSTGGPLPRWPDLMALLTLPLAAEVIFRGVIQGHLVTSFPIQKCDGPWVASWPVVLTAALYAVWSAFLQTPAISLTHGLPEVLGGVGPLAGAALFGVAAGVARERSESIAAPILLHWICIAAVLLAVPLWQGGSFFY